MAIRLNSSLQQRTNPETGKSELFGKVGYQTMHEKLDRITLTNLRAIEAALDAGQLFDINGEPCTDHAVIDVKVLVTKVKDDTELELPSISSGGQETTVASLPDVEDPSKMF